MSDPAGVLFDLDGTLVLSEHRPVPGAAALVRRLVSAGVPVGVVTSGVRAYAHHQLAALGLADCFDVVVTAEDVRGGKPDPEGYVTGCARLGVDPAGAVGFEDSVAGVTAVKSAGMTCIAVATTADAVSLGRADLVLVDLSEWGMLGWPVLAGR